MNSNNGALMGLECLDSLNNCTANGHLCSNPIYTEYMIKFCTKTCLKCSSSPTQPSTIQVETIAPPSTRRFFQSKMRSHPFENHPQPSDRAILEMIKAVDAESLRLSKPPLIPQLTAELSIASVDQNGRPLIGTNVISASPQQTANSSTDRQTRVCLDRHHK